MTKLMPLTAITYAKEFGSEQAYQLKPSRADSERIGLSKETRGRLYFSQRNNLC